MQIPQILYLIVLTGLFLVWAFLMFRMLWKITRNASAMNKPTDGFAAQTGNRMDAFFGYFRDPANRRSLIILGLLSALLMAMNVIGATLLGPT